MVIWADAPTAKSLVGRVQNILPYAPLYLCRKAAQEDSPVRESHLPTCNTKGVGIWTAGTLPVSSAMQEAFAARYKQRFGAEPGMGAAQAYDAVRVLAASLRRSGPNRARLRNALAEVSHFKGASGIISFDHAGNDLARVTIVEVR